MIAGIASRKTFGTGAPSTPPVVVDPPSGAVTIKHLMPSNRVSIGVPGVSQRMETGDWTIAGYEGQGDVPEIVGDASFPLNPLNTSGGTHNAEFLLQVTNASNWVNNNPNKWAIVLFPRVAYDYVLSGNFGLADLHHIIFRYEGGGPRGNVRFTGGISNTIYDYPYTGRFTVYGSLPGGGAQNRASWTGGAYPAGTTTVTLQGNSDILNGTFTAGKYAIMRQERFPTKWDKKFSRWYPPGSPATGVAYIESLVKIVSANPTTSQVTMDLPTYYDMDSSLVCRFEARPNVSHHIGFENFNFLHPANAIQATIAFNNCENVWVKNCTFTAPYSFAVQVYHTRYMTWEDCDYLNPQNINGGYNGYSGFVAGASRSLMRRVISRNTRHGPIFQSNSACCVITQCEFYNCDWHYHTLGTIGCLVDQCKTYKGGYGFPYRFDMPSAQNDIHDPDGAFTLAWNIDGGPSSVWNMGMRLGAFLDNCSFAYMSMAIQGKSYQRGFIPSRIPMMITFGGEGGPVRFFNCNFGWDHEGLKVTNNWSDAQANQYTNNQMLFDRGPGTLDDYNGKYGQQTGLYGYPGYQCEAGSFASIPEVNSNYQVEFYNVKSYGFASDRLFASYNGTPLAVNQGFQNIDSYAGFAHPQPPAGYASIFDAVKAFKAANANYWVVGE